MPSEHILGPVTVVDAEDDHRNDDRRATAKTGKNDHDYAPDSDEMETVAPPSLKTQEDGGLKAPKRNGKRKSDALEENYEPEDGSGKKSRAKPRKETAKSSPKKPRASKARSPESKETQDILDSIPTVRPPTPPAEKKFNFATAAQHAQPSPGAGTKEIPTGAENCLAGLSFVFTGILESLGREEGQELVKRYGGKVVGAPSSKTSYVVLGADAGPKKLETISKHKLKTINEEGLFALISKLPANGGDSKAAEQHAAKKKAEEDKVKAMAAEIDREEKKRENPSPATPASTVSKPAAAPPTNDSRLWTTKYAPTSLNMICGNKKQVEQLQSWLHNWKNSAKAGFKKPGRDGSGLYRSVMIHGPPGIGKTTAAHLVAKIEGYDVVESNASDTRSKKLVDDGLTGILDTTSLQGYFSRTSHVESSKKNMLLIMDEVDGMSAGDRGGVGAMAATAKKTKIPMILICNERSIPKMRPFDHICYELPFRRPTPDQIRARLSTICYREGIKIPPPVLDGLIQGTHSDIRQLINMLSTAKLDAKNLDYDQGKAMSKAWEKHVILKPWDITGKILSPQMFTSNSSATMNDKLELYFNDHEFSYLMVQENYLKTNPTLASPYEGPERKYKMMELADNAAMSISDGDLVDRMIHGSQQQWSLMPTHAAFSFVRPASFMYGSLKERIGFTNWLGNNSRQGMYIIIHACAESVNTGRQTFTRGQGDAVAHASPSIW